MAPPPLTHPGSQADQLRQLIDAIQEFIVLKDGQGHWLVANQAVIDTYELEGIDYLGKTDRDLGELQPNLREAFEYNTQTDEAAWQHGTAFTVRKSFMGLDGRVNTWEVVKTPIFNEQGRRHQLVIVSRNVTDRQLAEDALKASETKLQALAYRDPLTNVANRRLLLEHMNETLQHAMRTACSFAVLYLDLDSFKPINDSHGHDTGDRLLIALAKRIEAAIRPIDLLARIGGDEFVVLLRDVTSTQAEDAARRLCAVLQKPWSLGDLTLQTTSSIGIALYPDHGNSVHALLLHADQALYSAKRSGRACIAFHGSTPDFPLRPAPD